ncbi:MAG TPA: class I SAM-dependent methyltransferase [Planctomycetaceae bacterium]|nr:class I SAM-dependent methyltransferase [Planctomycetaceae bacterium]
MHSTEYDRMAELEGEHWWYRGFRGLVARLLCRWRPKIAWDAHVLDAGCGTGENLRLLQASLRPASLSGFDVSEQAVTHAREKMPEADVYVSDLCHPDIHGQRLDVILCADVVYMTGLEAALPGLQTLVSHLPRGGLLLLHVPAFNWLYSRHDIAVGTRHRFTRGDIRALLAQLGLTQELLTYRMFLLFPAVLAARLPSLLFGTAAGKQAVVQSDLNFPPRWLNACLAAIVGLENWLIARGMRFPWGSSIIAVGRKP